MGYENLLKTNLGIYITDLQIPESVMLYYVDSHSPA